MSIDLATPAAKTSYALGIDVANTLSRLPVELDRAAFCQGFNDMLSGTQPQLSPEEFRTVMQAFQAAVQERSAQAQSTAGGDNRKEGEAFLAKNRTAPGVVVTASGLQYQVLTAGNGPKPKASDEVTVHYTGRLLDGTEFDSSVGRGEPATFQLDQVIPGWTEGVQLMSVGGKFRFFIPSTLAYGERGAGQVIGPHSALIFDVELLAIGAASA